MSLDGLKRVVDALRRVSQRRAQLQDRTGRLALMSFFSALGTLCAAAVALALATQSATVGGASAVLLGPPCVALGIIVGNAVWRGYLRRLGNRGTLIEKQFFEQINLQDDLAEIDSLGLNADVTSRLKQKAYERHSERLERLRAQSKPRRRPSRGE